MTDPRHDFHKKKFKEKDFSLEVDFTESLCNAMSKIPNLKNADLESDLEQLAKESSVDWEPFVEIGAFNKLLSVLKPDCLKFTESSEASLAEVISRLKYLLEYWNSDSKKIKAILANDNSLVKCDQCGVISLRKRKCRKPLEKATRNFIIPSYLPRSPIERVKSVSYSKVHEERMKLIQKDEKRNNFYNPLRENEKNKRFYESSIKSVSNFCGSLSSERQINSVILNEDPVDEQDEKINIRKFAKYSERPVIHVDAPSLKPSNNTKSKIKLAQFVLNRKLSQKMGESVPKVTTIGNSEDNLIVNDDCKMMTNVTQSDEQKIAEPDKKLTIVQSKTEGPKESNSDFSEKESLTNQKLQKDDEKYLEKGDSPYFPKKKSFPHLPTIEGSYINPVGDPDDLKLKSAQWVSNDENMSQVPEMNCKNALNEKRMSLSQIEEDETTVFNSSSAENSVDEWLNTSLRKAKVLSKKNKKKSPEEKVTKKRSFLKKLKPSRKNLQTIGMQTAQCSSSNLENRNKIDEPTDNFLDSKLTKTVSDGSDKKLELEKEDQTTIKSLTCKKLQSKRLEEKQNVSGSTITVDEETSKISCLSKNILEGKEKMNLETFEQLIETLNTPQSELWKNICSIVKNEANRVSGTEVCIELKSISPKTRTSSLKDSDEISFEMDMPLKSLEDFLSMRAKSCMIDKK